MQATVRREQSERDPAFVERGVGGAGEAADVVAPERRAGHAEAQAAAQVFGHRFKRGFAIATPMHGEFLTANRRRAREDERFAFAVVAFEQLEDRAVV
jgi:hypothetical protein